MSIYTCFFCETKTRLNFKELATKIKQQFFKKQNLI
jgi:hypothetical protein